MNCFTYFKIYLFLVECELVVCWLLDSLMLRFFCIRLVFDSLSTCLSLAEHVCSYYGAISDSFVILMLLIGCFLFLKK